MGCGANMARDGTHDLARGMGGDLTVESTLGVGSNFTLTLPATTPAAPEETGAAASPG